MTSRGLTYALSFVVAAVGFMLPFWPLCALGILVAALAGRYAFAIVLALLIDLGFGMPTGSLSRLVVPFTLLAGAAAALRLLASSYFLDKTPPDTL